MKYIHLVHRVVRKLKERMTTVPYLKSTLTDTLTEQGVKLMALGSMRPRRTSVYFFTM